jgi:hypothetical protein
VLEEVKLVYLFLSLLNHLTTSLVSNQNVEVLVLEVVDGVGISLVD